MNVTHRLDSDKVTATVEARVAEHERQRDLRTAEASDALARYEVNPHLFGRRPTPPDEIAAIYAGWIAREREYYATVRVVQVSARRFLLVYGDVDDAAVKVGNGTGPFKSLDKAADWFFKQGR